MSITTDQPVISPEDRPTELTEPLHRDPPGRSRPATKSLRTALGWVISIVAVAAVLVVVIFDANPPSGGITPVENQPTELDVHGIPTWWSGEQAAPGRIAPVENRPTEIDVHGIPTWWSGEPAVAGRIAAVENGPTESTCTASMWSGEQPSRGIARSKTGRPKSTYTAQHGGQVNQPPRWRRACPVLSDPSRVRSARDLQRARAFVERRGIVPRGVGQG